MKIAHFYHGIYLNGGVSLYIQNLTALQIAAGDDVVYFELTPTTAKPGGIRPLLIEDETRLFDICRAQSIDVLHFHKYPAALPPADLNAVYTIHEHTPHCLSGGLFLKNRQMPCPRTYRLLSCSFHHLRDHCGSVRPNIFIRNLQRIQLQRAVIPKMKTVCVGHFLKSRMIKAGYDEAGIRVIPNFTGADIDSVEMTRSGVPQFLFIGRLEKLKGVEWLLRAFATLKTPAALNICGEGNDAQMLKLLARDLELEDRVKFLGWVEGKAKTDLLHAARAVIVPSIWHETFGLVAIEAAACARPLIVSDAGELPYIVENGQNGVVIPVGDIGRLNGAIEEFCRNPDRAMQMGIRNQLKQRALYSPASHKQQIDEVYAARR